MLIPILVSTGLLVVSAVIAAKVIINAREKKRKANEERERLERERKKTTEEVRYRERRTPVKRGGRPRGLEQKGEIGRPPRTRPHSLKPELVCWKDGWRWCVGIEVPEGSETLNISQREEVLERDPLDESRYPLRHIGGVVKLAWTSEEEYIPLLSTERNYLIFKMRKDWKGLGRSIRYPTMGHYLVIVPPGWIRDEEVSGPASVKPEDVQSDGYKAHFFIRIRMDNWPLASLMQMVNESVLNLGAIVLKS